MQSVLKEVSFNNTTIMTINEFNFAGKKAIVRVDFNVPLDENGKITDDTTTPVSVVPCLP